MGRIFAGAFPGWLQPEAGWLSISRGLIGPVCGDHHQGLPHRSRKFEAAWQPGTHGGRLVGRASFRRSGTNGRAANQDSMARSSGTAGKTLPLACLPYPAWLLLFV